MKNNLDEKYNPFNIIITLDTVSEILTNHNVSQSPKNIDLYQQSFVHRSYLYRKKNRDCPENIVDFFPTSNERLEFLGDAIISSIVVSYLFKRYPKSDEGCMTRIKTNLVIILNLIQNKLLGENFGKRLVD